MLRQDDAIASLMQNWGQEPGAHSSSSPSTTTTTTATAAAKTTKSENSNRQRTKKRKLPELKHYPNNTFLAGNHSIWNPYVQAIPLDGDGVSGNNQMSSVIPTNPQVEVVRRRAYEAFKKDCLEIIQRIVQQSFRVKFSIPSVLEKWHMDAKHKEKVHYEGTFGQNRYPILASTAKINAWTRQNFDHYFDPMLLSNMSADMLAPLLKDEILRSWKQQDAGNDAPPPKLQKKLNQVHKGVYKIIAQTRESYAKNLQQAAKQSTMQATTKSRKQPKITRVEDESLIQVTFAGNSFRIHPAYHEKLQRLYDRQQEQCGSSGDDDDDDDDNFTFEEALFCLLCRYDMLQGAGLQAGVPGSIMDTLLDKLDCRMECFASPLNCRYETFASAFDLDRLFGSRSSFFHLPNLPSGCYQANPPFCDGVIGALSRKMEFLLHKASHAPLMFVVFVPAWKDSKSYQQLLGHKYLSKHLLLDQGKHWYAEGTQHRRQDSFRVASFDTSILFYQNDTAKKSWPVNKALLEALTESFCQDPGEMDKKGASSIPKISSQNMAITASESIDGAKESTRTKPPNKKGSRKSTRGKKRTFAGGEEEHAADLNVLKALGLLSKENENDGEQANATSNVVEFGLKEKRRKEEEAKVIMH